MHRFAISLTLLSFITLMGGCKNGYNKLYSAAPDDDTTNNTASCTQTPAVDAFTADAEKNTNTQKTLTLLAELGCDKIPGMLSGQNLGYGSAIDDDVDNNSAINNSYKGLITPLTEIKHTPAIIGVDYAFDKTYSPDDLIKETNAQLRTHWKNKGFVSISWSPLNPWTKKDLDHSEAVKISDLLDTNSTVYTEWNNQLNNIVNALKDLKDNGNVIVLWRPFPQMNSEKFWWGTKATATDKTLFTKLWTQVFDRFKENNLTNILWVYSPTLNLEFSNDNKNQAIDWAYPGNTQVDVVGPVLHNFALEIQASEYKKLTDLKRVIALGDAGPGIFDKESTVKDEDTNKMGGFDNRFYSSILLAKHPELAYWVSWHDLEQVTSGKKEFSFQSLNKNPLAKELFERELFNDKNKVVLTVERIVEKKLRDGFK